MDAGASTEARHSERTSASIHMREFLIYLIKRRLSSVDGRLALALQLIVEEAPEAASREALRCEHYEHRGSFAALRGYPAASEVISSAAPMPRHRIHSGDLGCGVRNAGRAGLYPLTRLRLSVPNERPRCAVGSCAFGKCAATSLTGHSRHFSSLDQDVSMTEHNRNVDHLPRASSGGMLLLPLSALS